MDVTRIQDLEGRRACGEKSLPQPLTAPCKQRQEGGWALLGLILALTVLGILLVSSVTPNYKISVQREKEAELIYRGNLMAEGIARWYNNGNLGPVAIMRPPAYGHLKELVKLKEGVRLGVREIKFVRPSATIDPMSNEEWEPVYARDPRIMPFVQAWSIETGGILSPEMLLIAGPPGRTLRNNSLTPATPATPAGQTPGGQTPGAQPPAGQPSGTSGQAPIGGRSGGQNRTNPTTNPNDDDDDDDEEVDDPLAHLFRGSSTNLPIVGVAPKLKGRSVRGLYGLQNYEEWVFLYIPLRPVTGQPTPPNPINGPQERRRTGQ